MCLRRTQSEQRLLYVVVRVVGTFFCQCLRACVREQFTRPIHKAPRWRAMHVRGNGPAMEELCSRELRRISHVGA